MFYFKPWVVRMATDIAVSNNDDLLKFKETEIISWQIQPKNPWTTSQKEKILQGIIPTKEKHKYIYILPKIS